MSKTPNKAGDAVLARLLSTPPQPKAKPKAKKKAAKKKRG